MIVPVDPIVGVVFIVALPGDEAPGMGRLNKELRKVLEAVPAPLGGWLAAPGLISLEVQPLAEAFGAAQSGLLAAMADPEAALRWKAARWALIVRGQAPCQVPLALLAALAAARGLAALRGAVVYDEALEALFLPDALPVVQPGPFALRQHLSFRGGETRGLSKWGLPELSWEGAVEEAESRLLPVVRALFEVLIGSDKDQEIDAVDLSDGLVVDADLIARAFGEARPDVAPGVVDVAMRGEIGVVTWR